MNQETLNYFRNELRTTRAELEKVKQERQELADAGIIVSRALTQAATDLSEALEVISRFEASCICQAGSTGKPCFDCQAAARLRERRGK